MSGSRNAKLPAGKLLILLSSKWSPMPTLNVPERTVTFSLCGCQCGDRRYPSGIFNRMVYSPLGAPGLPSSTASCAPAGTNAGGGPYGIDSGVNTCFSVDDCRPPNEQV